MLGAFQRRVRFFQQRGRFLLLHLDLFAQLCDDPEQLSLKAPTLAGQCYVSVMLDPKVDTYVDASTFQRPLELSAEVLAQAHSPDVERTHACR